MFSCVIGLADERKRDNETVRGELAIGRGSSRHNLVFGRSIARPDHDAVMRIGSEAPGRRAHSRNRYQHHGLLRVTATSDRDRNRRCSVRQAPRACLNPSFPLTLLAIRRQPEPRRWSPGATGQSATCAPEPRSLFCVFCQRSQFVSDTTGLMHCLSGSQLRHR